jgi:hypothetical protein
MKTLILTTDTPGHMVALNGFPFRLWPQPVEVLKDYTRIITLGTPIIRPDLLSCGPEWMNLHGGNPEYYRGLDSHLWAIYHNDFNNVVTTLHYIDEGIDTGDIIFQCRVEINSNLYINNMEVCGNLISMCQSQIWLPRRRQVKLGRYYGAMPQELKERVNEKIHRLASR